MKKTYNSPEFKTVPFDFEEIMDVTFVESIGDPKVDPDELED